MCYLIQPLGAILAIYYLFDPVTPFKKVLSAGISKVLRAPRDHALDRGANGISVTSTSMLNKFRKQHLLSRLMTVCILENCSLGLDKRPFEILPYMKLNFYALAAKNKVNTSIF